MSASALGVSLSAGHRAAGPGRFSLAGLIAVLCLHLVPLAFLAARGMRIAPDVPTVMVEMIAAQPVPDVSPKLPSALPPRAVPEAPTAVRRQAPGPSANSATAAVAEVAPAAETAPASSAAPATPNRSLTESVQAPRYDAAYLNNPAPDYPALSRRLGEEGKVVLRVLVGENGRPAQIEIRNSSGSPRLDQAALTAVGRWQFVAARRGEEFVAAWVLVPLVFNLRG